jgi:conjugal transfer mating pair stabilization protein TraG
MNSRIKKILFIIGLFTSGSAISAELVPLYGNAWTYYSLGAGETLTSIFQAINMMVNSGGYKNLLMFLSIVAFFTWAMIGFFTGRPARVIGVLIMAALYNLLLFQTTMTIQVQDRVTGYTNVVQNVPAMVGLPAVFVSQMGDWLTTTTETAFALPSYDGLKLSNGASFNMAAEILKATNTPVVTNSNLRASSNVYFNDCMVSAIANGTITPGMLLNDTNLLDNVLVIAASNALITKHYDIVTGAQTYMTCADAYTALNTDIVNVTPQLLEDSASQAKKYFSAAGAGATYFTNAITSSYDWLSGGAALPSPADIVRQNAVMTLSSNAFTYSASASGGSPVISAIAMEQAKAQQESSWLAAIALFSELGPMLFVILSAFVVAMAPIIIIGAMIPRFGSTLAVSYVQIMIWLALWQPALSIINFIISVFEQNAIGDDLTSGIIMANGSIISAAAEKYILMGGFIGTLLPMFLFALVQKGTMGVTGFLESAAGSSAIKGAADTMSSGNMNLGNSKMDTNTANKFDTAQTISAGYNPPHVTAAAGAGTLTENAGGTEAILNNQRANSTVSTSSDAGISQRNTSTQSKQRQAGESLSSSTNNAFEAGHSSTTSGSKSTTGSLTNAFNLGSQSANENAATTSMALSQVSSSAATNQEARTLAAAAIVNGEMSLASLIPGGGALSKGLRGMAGKQGNGAAAEETISQMQDAVKSGDKNGASSMASRLMDLAGINVQAKGGLSFDSSLISRSARDQQATQQNQSGQRDSTGTSASSGIEGRVAFAANDVAAFSQGTKHTQAVGSMVAANTTFSDVSSRTSEASTGNSTNASQSVPQPMSLSQVADVGNNAATIRSMTPASNPSVTASNANSGPSAASINGSISALGGRASKDEGTLARNNDNFNGGVNQQIADNGSTATGINAGATDAAASQTQAIANGNELKTASNINAANSQSFQNQMHMNDVQSKLNHAEATAASVVPMALASKAGTGFIGMAVAGVAGGGSAILFGANEHGQNYLSEMGLQPVSVGGSTYQPVGYSQNDGVVYRNGDDMLTFNASGEPQKHEMAQDLMYKIDQSLGNPGKSAPPHGETHSPIDTVTDYFK